jgi:hypothetical protein
MQLLKIYIIILILIIAQNEIFALGNIYYKPYKKKIAFELQTGFASYDFSSIIKARNEAIKTLPFPAKVTDDYPKNPYFQFEIDYIMKSIELGIVYSHLSTGSRVQYADYSGEYLFDNIISNNEYGIIMKTKGADELQPLKLQFFGEIGLSYTNIKSSEYLRVFEESNTYKDEFENSIYYLELGAKLNYYYYGFISGLGVSFFLEPSKELTIGFEGIRAHISIGYEL